jgi:hypothetical protein
MHRRRPLPTLGIEVGAAKRTTSGEWRDAFSALWAMAGMHVNRIPPCDHGPLNGISGVAKNVAGERIVGQPSMDSIQLESLAT